MNDDGSMRAGASPPTKPTGEPPGLRAQLGATVDAIKRLARAHVDLAKAEIGDIVDEVKRMVALAGAGIGMLFLAALLLFVGGLLFLGEWLFGSIGWGVLLGTLLLIDLAMVAFLMALDVKAGRIGSSFLLAAALGIAVGLVFGFDLPHRGWEALGSAVAPQVTDPNRTLNLAVGSLAAIGAVLGFVMGLRGGLGSALVGAIVLGTVGAILGWLTSAPVGAQVGAALGVLVALLLWPVFAGRDLLRTGVDGEAISKKFIPNQSIELGKETIEWVRARTPLVPKS